MIWHFLKLDKEIESIRADKELKELKGDAIEVIDTIETGRELPADPSMFCDLG